MTLWTQQCQKWQTFDKLVYMNPIFAKFISHMLAHFSHILLLALQEAKSHKAFLPTHIPPRPLHSLKIQSCFFFFFNLKLLHESSLCPSLHKWTNVESTPYKVISHSSFMNNVHKRNISRLKVIIAYFRSWREHMVHPSDHRCLIVESIAVEERDVMWMVLNSIRLKKLTLPPSQLLYIARS